jgi:two-component system sensor histidine kinase KdpD
MLASPAVDRRPASAPSGFFMSGPIRPEPASAPPARAADASFAELVRTRERGKLKIYIGSAAGTGKTFRMLTEAHLLRQRGIDAVVGFVETHGRAETDAQLGDLEVVPRRKITYRGVVLEEMATDAVVARRPQIAIVDELAHTNVPGTARAKRWEDVVALLDEGISVISAVNVQHLESLNDVIQNTLGVTVRETIPDWVITLADQVVNLDISAEDLRQRLIEGKIYSPDKVETALKSFFTEENLATLRELALREVASSVDRAREQKTARVDARPGSSAGSDRRTVDRVLVGMSSHPEYTSILLRKASRIAGRLNPDWYCVYVQTPAESASRIDATVQRKLVENIHRAQAMGAEVVKLESDDVARALCRFAVDKGVTLIIVGQSRHSWWQRVARGSVIERLLNNGAGIDVLVVSLDRERQEP